MGREDTFTSATNAFSMYGGFFKDVAQEIGREKALSLYAKQGELIGTMLAGMMKGQLGEEDLDMRTLASAWSAGFERSGFTFEIEENLTSIKMSVFQCPIYEGFVRAGLDHKTIESACRGISAAECAALKKVFPQLSGCLKFRTAPDKPCVEEFFLEK